MALISATWSDAGPSDRESQYFLIGLPAKVDECGPLPPNFHAVPLADRENTLRGSFEFRATVRRLHCDVSISRTCSGFRAVLPCPYMVTVHDLLDHTVRRPRSLEPRRSLHLQLTRRALRKAARVLAVSQFTKSEIARTFDVPDGRIEVVYNAIDERFLHGHASQSDRDLITERYQVYPFLLYAGAIRPHKNVVRTIEAFSALKTELEKEQQLLDLKHHHRRRPLRPPRSAPHSSPERRENDVRFSVSCLSNYAHLYDVAKIFVFPSLYEGFDTAAARSDGPRNSCGHIEYVKPARGSWECSSAGDPENVFEIQRPPESPADPVLRNRMKQRGYQQASVFRGQIQCRESSRSTAR